MSKKLSNDEIMEILEIFTEAKAQAGQTVTTAVLIDEDNPEGKIVVDNRDDLEIN